MLASLELVCERSIGVGGTTASAGTGILSLAVHRPSRSSRQGPAVGTALSVSTPQSSAFCPGGSATTSSPRVARPVSCSWVRCATGIGNCHVAPTAMHATGVRWCVAVSSVMRAVGRGVSSSYSSEYLAWPSPPAVAAAAAGTLCLRCRFASALVRILR